MIERYSEDYLRDMEEAIGLALRSPRQRLRHRPPDALAGTGDQYDPLLLRFLFHGEPLVGCRLCLIHTKYGFERKRSSSPPAT